MPAFIAGICNLFAALRAEHIPPRLHCAAEAADSVYMLIYQVNKHAGDVCKQRNNSPHRRG